MVTRNLLSGGAEPMGLHPADAALFLEGGTPVHFPAGASIFQRGDPGGWMYVLLDGAVEIRLPELSRIIRGRGSYFGELAFLDPAHRRSASIYAAEDCRLVRLDQADLARISAQRPEAVLALLRHTCAVLVRKEETLSGLLREKNRELECTLDYLRRTREELSQQELLAQTDGLTGLYNRRCFDTQLDRFVERAEAEGQRQGLALIYIDLDHFKPINDTLGHDAGDAVLVSVSQILRSRVRRSDLPVRLGGDEFALLLLDVSAEQARQRAAEVRQAVAELPPPGQGLRVTCSMGGTHYLSGEPPGMFVRRADQALYATKAAGRDGLTWR